MTLILNKTQAIELMMRQFPMYERPEIKSKILKRGALTFTQKEVINELQTSFTNATVYPLQHLFVIELKK